MLRKLKVIYGWEKLTSHDVPLEFLVLYTMMTPQTWVQELALGFRV